MRKENILKHVKRDHSCGYFISKRREMKNRD